ncbi:MAG TPA: DUF6152 family protein, partial [Gammaproteobacteria bacterium]
MRFGSVAFGLAILGLVASSASAHHSFGVLFDPSRTVEVSGVVKEFQFIAPHSYILVDVTDEAG